MSRLVSLVLILLFSPFFMIVIIISFFSHGTPILFKQKRVGKDGIVFNMYKFRSMKNNTPGEVATHLLDNPRQYNTLFGGFLRKYSIDELPQLRKEPCAGGLWVEAERPPNVCALLPRILRGQISTFSPQEGCGPIRYR